VDSYVGWWYHYYRGGHKWTVMLVGGTITVEGVINGQLCWLVVPLL
jgi:hypothetical protein